MGKKPSKYLTCDDNSTVRTVRVEGRRSVDANFEPIRRDWFQWSVANEVQWQIRAGGIRSDVLKRLLKKYCSVRDL